MPIESSTVTTWSPPSWWSRSVRPRQGRISASLPGHHVRAVELGRDVHGEVAGPQGLLGAGRVGRRRGEVAAHARRTRAPSRRASRGSCPPSRARARGGARSRTRPRARRGRSSCAFSQMPMVRSPCTLECPRTGHRPAPGLPMLPRSRSRLVISWIVATASLVLGQAHRPADDDAVRLPVAQCYPLDLLDGQPGRLADVVPVELVEVAAVLVELGGVPGDELLVDGTGLDGQLRHRREQRLVAAETDLEEVVGEVCVPWSGPGPSAGCGTDADPPRRAG